VEVEFAFGCFYQLSLILMTFACILSRFCLIGVQVHQRQSSFSVLSGSCLSCAKCSLFQSEAEHKAFHLHYILLLCFVDLIDVFMCI
jgi:hypothetical protein